MFSDVIKYYKMLAIIQLIFNSKYVYEGSVIPTWKGRAVPESHGGGWYGG